MLNKTLNACARAYTGFEYIQASSWLNVLSKEPEKVLRDKVLKQQEEQDKRMAEMEEQLRQQGEVMAEFQRTLRLN